MAFQDEFILMLSTGRRDKDKMCPRMIFESDILRHETGRVFIVEYWSSQSLVGFDLSLLSREPGGRYNPLMERVSYPVWESDKWDIIGNRYEDPHLLSSAEPALPYMSPEAFFSQLLEHVESRVKYKLDKLKDMRTPYAWFDSAMTLVQLEIAEIQKDPDMDGDLLHSRMDTIYHNLRLANLVGYNTQEQKEGYTAAKSTFLRFQEDHGVTYDNDEL